MPGSFQHRLVMVTAVLLAGSFLGGQYPNDQPLHHIPTLIGLVVLWHVANSASLSNRSVLAIHLFLWLHILGARYIYSFVPYNEWGRALTGVSIDELFQLRRNHYDRLVHFAYGVLATLPQVELLRRRGMGRRAAGGLSFALVMGISAGYEIFEWLLAVTLAPGSADRYNGQQGDLWDAQKDMACAGVGALVTTVFLARSSPAMEMRDPSLRSGRHPI